MAATELTINQKRRLLERSRAGRGKLSAQFLFCKTGHAETDVKARSLQQRKDLLRQAQADVASKSAAGLGADEKALLRFRQTSLSLLAYEDERSQADHTDSNLRLLLVSEALSKLSKRAILAKPALSAAPAGDTQESLETSFDEESCHF